MTVYLDLVIGLNFGVDLLLLLAVDRICGYPTRFWRCCGAGALGGLYGGVCALPGFSFLGNTLWRLIFLAIMSVLAFGWNRSVLRRGVLFVLLSMALGGIALGMGSKGGVAIIASAAGLFLLCAVGFRGRAENVQYAQVVLRHGSFQRKLLALRDTGNLLKDPVTGRSVLIVGPEVAWELLGLTADQLSDPIGTLQTRQIPGLRLMPYRTVGQPGGMLLAMKLEQVIIDGQRSGHLVAFAPGEIGAGEAYKAIAGGGI